MHQGTWNSAPPASEEELQVLRRTAPIELPESYRDYLRESNGGGGDIPIQPWLVYFWKAHEVHVNNVGYQVATNVPGFYAFGTSGGGEMFAFDARQEKPWAVVIIPFIPMDAKEAIQIAPDFASFRKKLGYSDEVPIDEIRLDDWGHPLNKQ